MAVFKKEFNRNILSAEELKKVEKLEKEIDDYIKKERSPGRPIEYLLGYCSDETMAELKQRYQLVGWVVKFLYNLEGECYIKLN